MKKIKIVALLLAGLLLICTLTSCYSSDVEKAPVESKDDTVSIDTDPISDSANTNRPAGNQPGESAAPDNQENNPSDSSEETITEEAPEQDTETTLKIYSIGTFSGTLAPISTSKGYGYIDIHGKIAIEPAFEDAGPFYIQYARVKIDGKYGYIDLQGNIKINPVYDQAPLEFNDVTRVKKDGVWQYINKKGTAIYIATGNEVAFGEYSNGYFWVETQEKLLSGNIHTVTYYDKNGEIYSERTGYRNMGEYSSCNRYGVVYLIDENRNEVVMCPDMFGGKINGVQGDFFYRGTSLYYIDSKNMEIIPADELYHADNIYWTISHLMGNPIDNEDFYLAAPKSTYDGPLSSNVNCGYNTSRILKGNQLLLNLYEVAEYIGVHSFQCVNGWLGKDFKIYFTVRMVSPDNITFFSVIDEHGNVLITPTSEYKLGYEYKETVDYITTKYYVNYGFSAGVCKAQDTKTGLYGYIDMQGNWIIQPQFKEATDFHGYSDDAAAVVNGNTVINLKGEVILTTTQSD